MVVESLLFCLREGAPPAKDCPTLTFFPLRGSILRLRRVPSLRGYPLRVISLSLSHRFGDPSSAFGAPLLQGATHFGLSLFRFHTAARIHPAPLARPFSKGLLASGLSLFRFHTAAGIHPPPSARPFSKGLLTSGLSHFRFHTAATDWFQAIANVPG